MAILTGELAKAKEEIRQHALDAGLDFFDVIFEVVDWKEMNAIAAYGGFPNRYPHWSFGMEYGRIAKSYQYGLSKIYEMVINTDPSYAYLLHGNAMVDQKLVMAHVYAHVDFFKNNVYFSQTNRKMMDKMGNHRTKVMGMIEKHGLEKVENFIDTCMSIENLIDYKKIGLPQQSIRLSVQDEIDDDEKGEEVVKKLRSSKSYLDKYINPAEFLERERQKLEDAKNKAKNFPEEPDRDVLKFLIENAPMERWQKDLLNMFRDESYYFAPQGMTKIMNEGWACVAGDTLIFTEKGLIPAKEIVDNKLKINVSDGNKKQLLYDWEKFPDRKSIIIKTRRGFRLEGSTTHQILLQGEQWKKLDEVRIGDKIAAPSSIDIWPTEYQKINWQPEKRPLLSDIAKECGISSATINRHRNGQLKKRNPELLIKLLSEYETQLSKVGATNSQGHEIIVPKIVDEKLGLFLGYLIGDGHISLLNRELGFTSGDKSQADSFARIGKNLFNVTPKRRKDGNRWRVKFYSGDMISFCQFLGLKTGVCARLKEVPACVLRSPKSVITAFIRALFDCDGYGGPAGAILSTSSNAMSEQIQMLLLNFGILSSKALQHHDIWNVYIRGLSAKKFLNEIGFSLKRRQKRLLQYVNEHQWFKKEFTDTVTSIEYGECDVYDFTVKNTHKYVASGMINHNSYHHSKIMTSKVLTDADVIDYADHCAGTLATSPGRLNPYKLGIELYRHVEDRWNKGKFGPEYENCDNMVEKKNWNKNTGLGRQKIFEIRKLHNDLTFLDAYMDREFCEDQKLFTFDYHSDSNAYIIADREFRAVKTRLLDNLTNMGNPQIAVVDANTNNRGELTLKHTHDGVDLKMDWAFEVMKNIQSIWGRPVHIETIIEGSPKLITCANIEAEANEEEDDENDRD